MFYKELKNISTIKQKQFTAKLIPTINSDLILGVKVPDIRKLAKILYSKYENKCYEFIENNKHKFLEEYILHTSFLEIKKDYNFVIKNTNNLIKNFDNWMITDTYNPKIFSKNLNDVIKHIEKWIKSNHPYIIRFGIKCFKTFYLQNNKLLNFNFNKYYDIIAKDNYMNNINYDNLNANNYPNKYYVEMMKAWFFSEVLIRDFNNGIKYLKNNKLIRFTHNMTIKKCVESYRLSDRLKSQLIKLKL